MKSMVEDILEGKKKRPIQSVAWGHTTIRVGQDWSYGKNFVTKIEIVKEHGQMYYVPWVAIWDGDQLLARADAAGAFIVYEVEEK